MANDHKFQSFCKTLLGCMCMQDASTASLVWTLVLMAEHPEVLEKVRQEQATARPDLKATLSSETLAAMPYTRQVCKGKQSPP